MKNLLTTTAVIEGGSGLFMLTFPSLAATLLFGSPLDSPAGLTAGRSAGAALLAIGVASWLMRDDGQSRAAEGWSARWRSTTLRSSRSSSMRASGWG